MDALDRVAGPARDLLRRVDGSLLASGAPAEHRIWPLLRRVGALPGDVLAAVGGLAPEPVRRTAGELRRLAGEYGARQREIAVPVAWRGAAAEAYAARWADLGAHLATGPAAESLAGRLSATAEYLDDVADWMGSARATLAEALAVVLGSAEAVALHARPDATAAAAVGARVLDAAATAHDEGLEVHARWAGRLDELPYRPATTAAQRPGGTTSVSL
jgi:hypothetical protein